MSCKMDNEIGNKKWMQSSRRDLGESLEKKIQEDI